MSEMSKHGPNEELNQLLLSELAMHKTLLRLLLLYHLRTQPNPQAALQEHREKLLDAFPVRENEHPLHEQIRQRFTELFAQLEESLTQDDSFPTWLHIPDDWRF